MKNKAEEKLNQILLQVGATRGAFRYPGLTSNRTITPVQRKVLFEKYIDKLPYFDKWLHVASEGTFYREQNSYMWKNQQEMEQRYTGLVEKISPHNPRKGRKPNCHTKITTEIELGDWETALQNAVERRQYKDVAIMSSLDRKLQNDKVIVTSAYESNGGRLYSSIQNISKLARRDLFRNWYDYDINAALPSVIYHLNRDQGDLILEYIQNKKVKREYLAELLEVEKDVAKRVINAVFFGVKTDRSVLKWDLWNDQLTSLVRLLGEKVTILMWDKWFIRFSNQVRNSVKIITDRIKDGAVRSDRKWTVRNLNGDILELFPWHQGRVICHCYYGIERMIIAALNLPSSNIVLIHDGFVVDRKVKLLENFSFGENLDLNISFSIEQLQKAEFR